MRKNVFGRKFKRDVNARVALFKGLMSELVLHGRIKTTLQKAKAIQASAEKLVTKAQKNGNLAKKLLSKDLIPAAIEKVMSDIAPKFASRNGGYTRFNDDASMVVIEWVEGVGLEEKGQSRRGQAEADKGKSAPKKEKVTKEVQSDIVEGEIVTEKPQPEADRPLDEKAKTKKAVSKKAK